MKKIFSFFMLVILFQLLSTCKSNVNILDKFKNEISNQAKVNNFPDFYNYLSTKEEMLIKNNLIKNTSRESYKYLIIKILKNTDKNYWEKITEKLDLKDEISFYRNYHNPVETFNQQLQLNNKPDCNTLQLSYMNDILVEKKISNLLVDMWLVTNFDNKYSRLNFTYVILYIILKKSGANI